MRPLSVVSLLDPNPCLACAWPGVGAELLGRTPSRWRSHRHGAAARGQWELAGADSLVRMRPPTQSYWRGDELLHGRGFKQPKLGSGAGSPHPVEVAPVRGGLAGRHAGELLLQPPWPRGGERERRCWGREDLGCSFAFSAGEGRDLGFDPSVMRNPYLQMRLAFRSGLSETVLFFTFSYTKACSSCKC